MMEEEDEQTRVFYQLCSMIINILGSSPFPIPFPLPLPVGSSTSAVSSRPTPAAFASLFLGISVALMLFGSAIFVIGFILMPWVIALVLLFYVAAVASCLSDLAHAILCPSTNRLHHVAGSRVSQKLLDAVYKQTNFGEKTRCQLSSYTMKHWRS